MFIVSPCRQEAQCIQGQWTNQIVTSKIPRCSHVYYIHWTLLPSYWRSGNETNAVAHVYKLYSMAALKEWAAWVRAWNSNRMYVVWAILLNCTNKKPCHMPHIVTMTCVYTARSVCITIFSTKSTHFQILWSLHTKLLLKPLLVKPKPILPDILSPLGPVLQSCSIEAHINRLHFLQVQPNVQMCCRWKASEIEVQVSSLHWVQPRGGRTWRQ